MSNPFDRYANPPCPVCGTETDSTGGCAFNHRAPAPPAPPAAPLGLIFEEAWSRHYAYSTSIGREPAKRLCREVLARAESELEDKTAHVERLCADLRELQAENQRLEKALRGLDRAISRYLVTCNWDEVNDALEAARKLLEKK